MQAHLPDVLEQIQTEARALFGRGEVASYIPALAQVAPRQFGMAVALTDGTPKAIQCWVRLRWSGWCN